MSLRQDIGYGWRLWRKHPLPAPYRELDRLVIPWSVNELLRIDALEYF